MVNEWLFKCDTFLWPFERSRDQSDRFALGLHLFICYICVALVASALGGFMTRVEDCLDPNYQKIKNR